MDPVEFITSALTNGGFDTSCLIDSLKQLRAEGIDAERLLYCLAIDVKREGVDLTLLHDSIKKAAGSGSAMHVAVGTHITGKCQNDFLMCAHPVVPPDAPAKYGSFMTVHKFVYLFRGTSTAAGTSGVASILDYLQAFPDGAEERGLANDMRGQLRPITWVTDMRALDDDGVDVSVDLEAVVQKLGLPWPAGLPHHVVLIRYPDAISSAMDVGQPNVFCETWDSPGIFVSYPGNPEGWGWTCQRTVPSLGLKERVHGPIAKGKLAFTFRAEHVGTITLSDLERTCALENAKSRWESCV